MFAREKFRDVGMFNSLSKKIVSLLCSLCGLVHVSTWYDVIEIDRWK